MKTFEIEDYPKTFEEFIFRFQSEQDCIDYIAKLKWPNGFICPKCRENKGWKITRGRYHCSSCDHQTTVTAGTIFEKTRKPLRLWFHIMWWVMSQKTGASAKNLTDMMGFAKYQTAWAWLHKFRRAMIRPGRERLIGTIEVDETYLGIEEEGSQGRKIVNKDLIVIAVEINEKKLGRARFRCIPNASGKSLIPFVKDYVENGSIVITDGWRGYSKLSQNGYQHEVKKQCSSEEELLPHVHLIISLVKRWLMGTHQGAVSSKHLPYYLDEYAFRFNRRFSKHRGKLFYRLMQQAVSTHVTTYKEIVIN